MTIVDATSPEQLRQARQLFEAYAASLSFDLCFQNFREELDGLPGGYAPPGGRLWLAITEHGEAAGCVALRGLEPGIGEMKRLYVRPEYRGTGLGRVLAQTVLEEAAAIGYQRLRLDTTPTMTEAIRLYESLGFTHIAPYRPNRVRATLCMEIQFDDRRRDDMDIAAEFMSAITNSFEANKRLADRAVEQVPDDKLHVALDANTNSIAVITKHVAGNLISRWTDFLTVDGEKPWRNRDDEFVDSFGSRRELLELWERGWACLRTALKCLTTDDLGKTVMIRGEPHSVPLALERSLGHTSYHVGQIVQVARIHAGETWSTLTIPRGGSERFNTTNWGQSGKSHS
jgi:ribosomal protein S18 acetylase RimI-like enzyme